MCDVTWLDQATCLVLVPTCTTQLLPIGWVTHCLDRGALPSAGLAAGQALDGILDGTEQGSGCC